MYIVYILVQVVDRNKTYNLLIRNVINYSLLSGRHLQLLNILHGTLRILK